MNNSERRCYDYLMKHPDRRTLASCLRREQPSFRLGLEESYGLSAERVGRIIKRFLAVWTCDRINDGKACELAARYQPELVIPAPGRKPVVVRLPLKICADHSTTDTARALVTGDGWAQLRTIARRENFRLPAPSDITVAFCQLR